MTWLRLNLSWVVELTVTHLLLSLPAVLGSLAIAVPVGWSAQRYRRVRGPLLTGVGLLYAIPSLPMLIMVPALLGVPLRSAATMITALTVYGVALLVQSAADAFDSVPDGVRQSATAMGFSSWSRFWRVELPLAMPVLLAGLRVVSVSTVGLVTVGAVIGISSLGTLFTDGLQRGLLGEVGTGLVLTVALALLLDGGCVLLGRLALPWTRVGIHLGDDRPGTAVST
ncbi:MULTISPECIES: ABC transporter permease [unclassified Modestobacter]